MNNHGVSIVQNNYTCPLCDWQAVTDNPILQSVLHRSNCPGQRQSGERGPMDDGNRRCVNCSILIADSYAEVAPARVNKAKRKYDIRPDGISPEIWALGHNRAGPSGMMCADCENRLTAAWPTTGVTNV